MLQGQRGGWVCPSEWLIEADTLPARGWKHFPGPQWLCFNACRPVCQRIAWARLKGGCSSHNIVAGKTFWRSVCASVCVCVFADLRIFYIFRNYCWRLRDGFSLLAVGVTRKWRKNVSRFNACPCGFNAISHNKLPSSATSSSSPSSSSSQSQSEGASSWSRLLCCWHVKHATLVTQNVRPSSKPIPWVPSVPPVGPVPVFPENQVGGGTVCMVMCVIYVRRAFAVQWTDKCNYVVAMGGFGCGLHNRWLLVYMGAVRVEETHPLSVSYPRGKPNMYAS